ncbi:YesN/AraC family two-component response regulator [Evansella vedderi]|uniref:YesN/AraC family two-component response regulator n=1 Tax=Evansella vedderi TaxID=38282 RepID=A0ABT9ZYU4_9BACI|nr:helix-turn-helix domain-containing protein [Evansella vedderi]MDQ0256426.1 YesN/AraC family two-component response regulator [Evansella vedderi]
MQNLRGKYFLKILFLIGVSMILIVFGTSIIIYKTANEHIDKQSIELNLEVLSHIMESLEKELNFIEKGTSELTVNRNIIQALYNKNLQNEYDKIIPLNEKLIATTLILNNVYSVDLYLPNSELFISSANGARSFNNMTEQNKEIFRSIQSLRRPHWSFNSPRTNLNVISFFQPLPLESNFPQGYFAIHVHESTFLQVLEEAHFSDLGDFYIIRRNGKIVLHNNRNLINEYKQFDSEISNLLLSGPRIGYHISPSEDNVLLFGKMEYSDWILIFDMPYSSLNNAKNSLAYNVMIISGICLSLSLFITYFISVSLHFPLKKRLVYQKIPKDNLFYQEWDSLDDAHNEVKAKLSELKTKIENDHQRLLEAFFIRLLFGSEDFVSSGEYSIQFLEQIKNTYPVVIVIEVEKVLQEKALDTNVMLLEVRSICRDVCNQFHVKVTCIPLNASSQFALILSFVDYINDKEMKILLRNITERLHQTLQTELQLQLSIGMGIIKSKPEYLKHSYVEAIEALKFRITKGSNQIISFDELRYTDPLQYPYSLEEQMIKELRNDNLSLLLNHFDHFVENIQNQHCSPASVYHAFIMLYTSLYRVVDENNGDGFSVLTIFQTDLQQKSSIKEIKKWFKRDILPVFLEKVNLMNENRSGKTIQMVMDYLNENVSETHTLTSVAEKFDLNASYLSRLFKQSTGKSFLQYLSSLKIRFAKKLLIETNLSVGEIAEKVGYTERTFGRVFKNLTNSTPTNYRMKHQKT